MSQQKHRPVEGFTWSVPWSLKGIRIISFGSPPFVSVSPETSEKDPNIYLHAHPFRCPISLWSKYCQVSDVVNPQTSQVL